MPAAAVVEYWPGTQFRQTVDETAASVVEYEPAVQLMQATEDVAESDDE